MCTHDVQASIFYFDGHKFDLSENQKVTKGEFRDFSEWFGDGERSYAELPERFRRWEVQLTPPETPAQIEHGDTEEG